MTILKRVSQWLLLTVTLLIVVWSFVDCGLRMWRRAFEDSGDRVTLTLLYWGTKEESAIVETTARAYEQLNPNVRIRCLHATDYDTKLKTMLAAGDPPDLFYLRYESVPEFAENGVVLELDEPIANAGPEAQGLLNDMYPVLLDAFRWDTIQQRTGSGSLVGLPKDFTTMVMYVNCDLFEQANVALPYDGWTWDEYQDAMTRIAALDDATAPNRRVYGGVIQTWPMMMRQLVWTQGGRFFGGEHGNDFTDVQLDEAPSIAMWQRIADMRLVDGCVYNATGISQSEDDLFRRGKVGSIGPYGRWVTPRFRKITSFQWDVVPLPHAPEVVRPPAIIATVAWAIASKTQHPQEAFDLLLFLCGPPGQKLGAELGLAIPSLQSVASSGAFIPPQSKPANSRLFLDLVAQTKLAQNPLMQQFDRILDQEVQKALRLGSKTPQEAAADIELRWREERLSPLYSREHAAVPWETIAWIVVVIVVVVGGGATLWFVRSGTHGQLARSEEWAGWLFISPWVIGFIVLVAGPMAVSMVLGFTSWSAMAPLTSAKWVGLDNFIHLFYYDRSFGQSLWVTAYYTLLAVPVLQVGALLVALLLSKQIPGVALFRTAYFVPSVVTGVALVTLWMMMLDNDLGMLNIAMDKVLKPLGLKHPDWFGVDSQWFASPALVLMALWGVGGGMVIYLAGLKSIPDALYEAARIDGAGPLRRLQAVTLPMLSPLIFFNVVMGIIGSFQIFTQAYVIRGSAAGGGTNEDLLFYVLNLYDQAFNYHHMGYASAMAWVLFLILVVLTLLVFRGAKRLVYYEGLKA